MSAKKKIASSLITLFSLILLLIFAATLPMTMQYVQNNALAKTYNAYGVAATVSGKYYVGDNSYKMFSGENENIHFNADDEQSSPALDILDSISLSSKSDYTILEYKFINNSNEVSFVTRLTNIIEVQNMDVTYGYSYQKLTTYENINLPSLDSVPLIYGKGNVLWNQTYEMQNPMVDINGSVVAIGDYNGRTIYIMNTQGSLGEVTTNLPIRNFRVAANGVVAVVLDDSKITRINLYDTSGNELVKSETTMDKSGYPIDISVSPNGELLAISYFYVDSGTMKTSIAFHNFGEVGQNLSSDRFVSGYDYQGTVVPFIRFMNSNTAFAVSDDRIMFFTGNEKPLSAAEKLLNEKVQSIFYNEQYIGLVFLNTDGDGRYRLDIYNGSGGLVTSKSFDMEYTNIIFGEDEFIICSETEYSVNNMHGVQRFADQFNDMVYLFVPAGKHNRFLMMTQDAMKVMEMK